MDYLLGLRLITALSVVGLAFLVGGKVYQLGDQGSVPRKVRPKVPASSDSASSKKLKADFWDKLTYHKN